MLGGRIQVEIDEQIIYSQLATKKNAVWSLLLASGYLKAVKVEPIGSTGRQNYTLALSYFDTGKDPSEEEPERSYHGFVLGLMVELADRYVLTSNRESGFWAV